MKMGIARRSRGLRLAGAAAAAALVLAGCGGGDIKQAKTSSAAGGKSCGELNIAVNPWTGYVTNAHLIGYVAETKLGCKVNYQDVKEEVGWQGMANGTIDTIVENWGHADLVKKYIDQQKTVENAGLTGSQGIIGWYVPPWMAQKYPDITNWKNLNKYAKLFKTSESGDKGQFTDGDPGYVTNDEALVKNLKLDFKVVYAGSEDALITGFRQAEQKKKPMIGYFYEPQWFLSEVPLVHVKLPPFSSNTTQCPTKASEIKCDYPAYNLNKVVAKKFADSGSPAASLVKNFSWTNDDQNEVAKYIAQDKMSPQAAADKWIAANPDKVKAWLG
jgi:glycine betaine/proline transport system substrate-binding protein